MSEELKRVVTCQKCAAAHGISVTHRRKRVAYLRCVCGHRWRVYDSGETIKAILVCVSSHTSEVVPPPP